MLFIGKIRYKNNIMIVQTKEHILDLIQTHTNTIRAMGVKRLDLFGSFERHEQHAESDVDLLVEFEPGQKRLGTIVKLASFLEEIFQRSVDLITPESLDPYIHPYIMGKQKEAHSPLVYLRHILDEATFLANQASNINEDTFLQDETIKRAFVRSLEIIGEAAKKLPAPIRESAPEINWKDAAGMRDRLIHGYNHVDYALVWETVVNDVPLLHQQIAHLLQQEEQREQNKKRQTPRS